MPRQNRKLRFTEEKRGDKIILKPLGKQRIGPKMSVEEMILLKTKKAGLFKNKKAYDRNESRKQEKRGYHET